MASEKKEKVEIKTHKIPGPRDPWKTWRRGKPIEIVSNPQDIPADEWLPPVEPPEVRKQRIREAQLKAGVGSFISRTEAAMGNLEDNTKKVVEKEAEKKQAKDPSPENSETSES